MEDNHVCSAQSSILQSFQIAARETFLKHGIGFARQPIPNLLGCYPKAEYNSFDCDLFPGC